MLAGYGVPRWIDEGWVEPKADGWRLRIILDPALPEGLVARTRRGRRLDLPELRPLAELGITAALDGELVAGAGRMADFYAVAPALASRRRRTPMTFAAFDTTYLDGDLTAYGYEERRAALEALEFCGPTWATLPRWPGTDAGALLEACEAHGVEGLVWKRGASLYRPGVRSSDWRKVKCSLWRQHVEQRRPGR